MSRDNHSIDKKPSSNRSFNSVQSLENQNWPSLNPIFNSFRTQKSPSQPSSTRSLNIYSKSSNQFLHSYDIGDRDSSRKETFGTSNFCFDSDIEVDCGTKYFDNVPLVIANGVKDAEASLVPTTSNDKDSTRSGQRSRKGKRNIRDPDSKEGKSRHPQLSKTDELGRASSHYKLEGVYFNQRMESKVKKAARNESNKEEEIQVLTKMDSDGNDTTNRSGRRGSTGGKDEFTRRRSRSREVPRAQKDITQVRSARDLGMRSSHIKSSDRRIKRGYGAKIMSPESKEALKKMFGLENLSSEENPIITAINELKALTKSMKDSEDVSLTEVELAESENQPSSMNITEESLADTEKVSKKLDSLSKDLEKKQRRWGSAGETTKKDRISTQSQEVAKKLSRLETPLSEKDPIVAKTTELKSGIEIENTTSESTPSSPSSMKDRRSITGKTTKKDRTSTRISNKSSHKSSRKFTHEKKYSSAIDVNPQSDSSKKNDPDLKVKTSCIEPSSSSVEEFVSASEKEIFEILNQDAKESTKNRSSTEKTTKKKKTSTRSRSSAKSRKSRGKDPTPIETDPQSDESTKDDPDSKVNTSNIEPTISSSVKEFNSESEKDINGIPDYEADTRISLNDLFSNGEDVSKKESNIFAPSLGSIESEEKDDNVADDANYLQLTFHSENYGDTDNLFAVIDEKFNQSFCSAKLMEGQKRTEDRNDSLRSFASFNDDIDLQVSTASFSLSKPVHEKGTGYVSADDGFADDDDDILADDVREDSTAKKKNLVTPMSRRKKKVSLFSISKSLHDVGRHHDDVIADGVGEDSPQDSPQYSPQDSPQRKRRGMLNKMKTGFSEGSRRTFQKASSTRNMLGQATTKVLSRRKEEGKGLLSNDSVDYSFEL
jgi:hypothetical protein